MRNQQARLNFLIREREIVLRDNPQLKDTPIVIIHDMRIEALERFLGLR